jgi:uracil-DNA glycosylase
MSAQIKPLSPKKFLQWQEYAGKKKKSKNRVAKASDWDGVKSGMIKPSDKAISRIVKMEERVQKCSRCKGIRICNQKPATGRGEVEPDILLVFLNENEFTQERSRIMKMREDLSKLTAKNNRIYHTFLVRCQAKICSRRKDKEVLFEGNMINTDKVCLLTNSVCDAINAEPDDQQCINCLHYLLEEVEILVPEIIITLGEKTYQYVFRAFGLFDPFSSPFRDVKDKLYRSAEYFFIPVDLPKPSDFLDFDHLKPLIQLAQG